MPSVPFSNALPFVLRWEGGYVNHPADPGGATNRGVTQKVYSAWLQRRGRPDASVRDLADADMQAIYEENYWKPAHCQELPQPLDQVQFDTAVNMGVGRAVRFLQEAVGAAVDGGFGDETRKCVAQADPGQAATRYLDIRERFYRSLVETKPELGVFLDGWLNRLNALRSVVTGHESAESAESAVASADIATQRIDDVDAAPVDEATLLREQAALLQEALAGRATKAQRKQAAALLTPLRNLRDWASLGRLAERLLRVDPEQHETRRLYAQALIDCGLLVPAIALLRPMAKSLPEAHREYGEAWGLIGRAHKQRFADLAGASVKPRKRALADAIEAYQVPYRADPSRNTWHGVNLLALVARARREGWDDVGSRWNIEKLAARLTAALKKQRDDEWTPGTLAEVALAHALATGDLDIVEEALRSYLTADGIKSFHVASTLRQFVEIWQLEQITPQSPGHALRSAADVQKARNLVHMLRARLLSLPKGSIDLPPNSLAGVQPSEGELQAVLGKDGARTFAWYRAGVTAADSVAAVRRRLGKRFGSGFLVRAGDLGLTRLPDELLLLTNFHVINPEGAGGALRPEDAEAVFEARDSATAYAVTDVVWCSPVNEHDACLVRLAQLPPGAKPLALSMNLPTPTPLDASRLPRVFVIGHPDGGELSVSMDDNELIDHEGPTLGNPPNKNVWRVHYSAPTRPGSSGSPVFEDLAWKVIALHHAGSLTMPQLNRRTGRYKANEGLAIGPLAKAAAAGSAPAAAKRRNGK
ncbi:MAG: trypsin-like peptidase domain-containing protein [Proteobacteria bacterium]|nr:trypsin-like peptidase domain-containing protein [Pseudomonadota bacterium]